jgi:serine/threonine-protein kinase RsbT
MLAPSTETLPIRASEDIVLVRTAVRKAALSIKLGLVDQTKLVTASSEIARNTLDYGGGGQVSIEILSAPKTGVRLVFEDHGPGIPDIQLALTDGWTSGSGMGLGLSGTRRLMDEFEIASKPGEGTTVKITKWSR